MSRPLVIAHRGASAARPENTLPAFELAVTLGSDMLETDLHLTRDGAVVLTHDASLAGLGGSGAVGDASLAEVRALDAGGGERVPELHELLDAFGSRVDLNLELKTGPSGAYPGLERAALDAVSSRGLLERTLFSCFDDAVLVRLRQLAPRARIALLVSRRWPRRVLERAAALRAEAVNPAVGLATARWISAAREAGLAVYPYTVDDEGQMRRLLADGASGLFTNHPERLRRLVDALPE